MTRTRHLTRTAVFAASSALLALAATGTAAAWSRSVVAASPASPAAVGGATTADVITGAPASGMAVAGVRTAASTSVPSPREPTNVVTPTPRTTAGPSTTPAATKAATTRPSARRTVTIRRYTYAPGSQRAIDQCKLVLWSTRPMWLAAHNYCGYQWLASVPTGRTITVTTGEAAGTYVVTGHLRLGRQTGSMPVVKADLVLQTCVGSGTGLTLARRVR